MSNKKVDISNGAAIIARQEELNKELRAFAAKTRNRLRKAIRLNMASTVAKMSLSERHQYMRNQENSRKARAGGKVQPLEKSIRYGIRKERDRISAVWFTFARHGIFYEHGVGRGRPIGSKDAKPNPWLSTVIPIAIQELSGTLAEEYADLAVEEIKIVIPGVIFTKITK